MDRRAIRTGAGELAEAKRALGQWRQSRERGRQIPEPLWRMAVKAAVHHGVQATARHLGLNSTRLKQWVQRLGSAWAEEDQAHFVELPWAGMAAVAECLVEAEDEAGRKLRIHLKGPATSQAVSLSRMLWRGEG